jgi:tetratricopeptide (TPR) repeat protein
LERSEPHFQQALELFESIGDEHGASNAIANYAWVLYYRKEYPAALEASERAYASYVRRGERRNSAIALRSIGLIKTELSRFCEATAHLNAALECFTDLGLLLDEAMALNCLGEACHRAGDLETAGRWLFRAVERSRECGSSYEEARAHRMLGQIAADRGDQRRAAYHWEHALSRYARLRAPQTRHVRGSLDPVRPVDGTSAEPA